MYKLIVVMLYPETKGKSGEDIERTFLREKSSQEKDSTEVSV